MLRSKDRTIKYRCLFICALLLVLSATVHAAEMVSEKQTIQSQAITDAKRDAQRVVNSSLWLLTGFVGNIIGVGASLTYKQTLPAEALIGKTPEYVAHYTNEFHRETQELQASYATTGCVSFVSLALIVLIVS